jgi:hypothetical protein
MAVGADHLAFRDLVKDALPASVRQCLGHIERLIAKVVELEDHSVELAAIGAGMCAEVIDEVGRPLEGE